MNINTIKKPTKLKITIENEILGNSEKIMSFDEVKDYNMCAYICAVQAINFGGKHSMGMWTVEVEKK